MWDEPAAGTLIGRAGNLDELQDLICAVEAGRGGCVLIEGEPGIGKSALLSRALAGATHSRCRVLHAVADELGTRFPLRVLMDSLPPEHKAVATEPMLAFSGVANPVIGAVEQLLTLVDRLCAESPVIWALDDLQWADEATVAVWGRLARTVEQLPLLLIATNRPVPKRPEVRQLRRVLAARNAIVLELRPLTRDETAGLVAELIQARPGPCLRALTERAAGNPLYVREIVAALSRSGLIRLGQGVEADVASDGSLWQAPVSLSKVIADRLDFLSGESQRMLRAAALLGSEFYVVDLAAVLDTPVYELADSLEEAHAAEVLHDCGSRSAFRHALIWQALYEAVPASLRSALHRQAAESLAGAGVPVERVAEQLVAAADTTDSWVVDWLVGQGSAVDGRAPQVAIELLRRVIDHGVSCEPRLEALEGRLVTLLRLLLRFDELADVARTALGRLTSREHRLRMALALAYALMVTAPREAARILEQVLSEEDTGPTASQLRSFRALILAIDGNHGDTATALRRAAADAAATGDPTASGLVLYARAVVVEPENLSRSAELIRQAVTVLGEELHTADLRVSLGSRLTCLLDTLRTSAEADAAFDELHALAKRTCIADEPRIHVFAATRHYDASRWDDGLAELESMEQVPPHGYLELEARATRALIAGHRGDLTTATGQLAAVERMSLGPNVLRTHSGHLYPARALLAERNRKPLRALTELRPLLDPAFDTGPRTRWRWLPEVVRLGLEVDDTDAVSTAVDLATADADRENLADLIATAECCEGLRTADPIPLLRAADRYRDRGRILEAGLALENAAVLYGRSGEPRASRAAFVDAVDAYVSLAAAWDVTRAESRLRALGIRRGARGGRRRPASGWEALTPTERQVASLVAAGRSNPDIAIELYLSRRTVQTHVSHILAKLGMHSRVEVAAAAPTGWPQDTVP